MWSPIHSLSFVLHSRLAKENSPKQAGPVPRILDFQREFNGYFCSLLPQKETKMCLLTGKIIEHDIFWLQVRYECAPSWQNTVCNQLPWAICYCGYRLKYSTTKVVLLFASSWLLSPVKVQSLVFLFKEKPSSTLLSRISVLRLFIQCFSHCWSMDYLLFRTDRGRWRIIEQRTGHTLSLPSWAFFIHVIDWERKHICFLISKAEEKVRD